MSKHFTKLLLSPLSDLGNTAPFWDIMESRGIDLKKNLRGV